MHGKCSCDLKVITLYMWPMTIRAISENLRTTVHGIQYTLSRKFKQGWFIFRHDMQNVQSVDSIKWGRRRQRFSIEFSPEFSPILAKIWVNWKNMRKLGWRKWHQLWWEFSREFTRRKCHPIWRKLLWILKWGENLSDESVPKFGNGNCGKIYAQPSLQKLGEYEIFYWIFADFGVNKSDFNFAKFGA